MQGRCSNYLDPLVPGHVSKPHRRAIKLPSEQAISISQFIPTVSEALTGTAQLSNAGSPSAQYPPTPSRTARTPGTQTWRVAILHRKRKKVQTRYVSLSFQVPRYQQQVASSLDAIWQGVCTQEPTQERTYLPSPYLSDSKPCPGLLQTS